MFIRLDVNYLEFKAFIEYLDHIELFLQNLKIEVILLFDTFVVNIWPYKDLARVIY